MTNKKKSNSKTIYVGGMAIILLVGVVIAIIAGVSSQNDEGNGEKETLEDEISTSMKAINTICDTTDYKEACIEALSSAADSNPTINPKELLKAAFEATIKEVESVLHIAGNISKKADDGPAKNHSSLSVCKEMLQYAITELQLSLTEVGDKDMHSLPDRTVEIKNWLSAVLAYQDTCKDSIDSPELKPAMEGGLINATQLTSNALAIVSDITSILTTFQIPFNLSSVFRSMIEDEVDNDWEAVGDHHEAYPTWFSTDDRRMLAVHQNSKMKPNVMVAKDESGNFNSISDALNAMPQKYTGRYVIYVKAGVYSETVTVSEKMVNVFMYGDGPRKTIVTGSKSVGGGVQMINTATFVVIGNGFIAQSMGFRNTAGAINMQALALRVQSDMSAFFNCRMDGYQDTLFTHCHRQFFRNCVISGTVDFIFGDSASVFQNCRIIVRLPMEGQSNVVTAQGRTDKREPTGIVIHNCRILPEKKLFPERLKVKSYLGRPWKDFSRTVIMETTIGDFIQPEGWSPWDTSKPTDIPDTLFYAEYGNRGPGAATGGRVQWPGYKVLTNQMEALQYTVGSFIQGNLWLRYTNTPYLLGLKKS